MEALAVRQQDHVELGERPASESEATFRALYDECPVPLVTVDADGIIVSANCTATERFGTCVPISGRPISSLFCDEDKPVVEQLWGRDWSGTQEKRLRLRDGRHVMLHAAPITGMQGARWHLSLHDMSARAVLDDAELQQQRLGALTELSGLLARELNDPMSIVLGRIELLLETGASDPGAIDRHLKVALEHARRIAATLHNLRLVGLTPTPKLDAILVSTAISEALDLLGPRSQRVKITIDVPSELAVAADGALLARALGNVLARAFDASSRSGDVLVRARRTDDEVSVRIVSGASLDQSGGLGLSVAHTLVASMGGRLEEHRENNDTATTLYLLPPPSKRARARPVVETVLAVGKDDLHRTLGELLDREGFAVRHVASAEDALALLDEGTVVDVLVTELLLPGMSGLALAAYATTRHPALRRHVFVVTDARLPGLPSFATALPPPLRRESLLEAFGRRVRRRR